MRFIDMLPVFKFYETPFFCHGLFLLLFVFEYVRRLHLFVLDSHLVTLWESYCPFGFLLVMFQLGSSYFVFVFLSL